MCLVAKIINDGNQKMSSVLGGHLFLFLPFLVASARFPSDIAYVFSHSEK